MRKGIVIKKKLMPLNTLTTKSLTRGKQVQVQVHDTKRRGTVLVVGGEGDQLL